jgi:hypothetical protein
MGFLQKYVYGVFELLLPRNAKNKITQKPRKKVGLVCGWVWDLADVGGARRILFWRPLSFFLIKNFWH